MSLSCGKKGDNACLVHANPISSLAILQGGVISFDFGIVYEIFHPDADFLHLD